MDRSFSHARHHSLKAKTRREWSWLWRWSWDSVVHPLFSWHHHVPCGTKYSGSEFHYRSNIDPNPLLQAMKTRYSAAFGIDTDIFSWCSSELSSHFPLQGNSILRFPGWSPSFCGISVSLQCPFPPFSSNFAWVWESVTVLSRFTVSTPLFHNHALDPSPPSFPASFQPSEAFKWEWNKLFVQGLHGF